MSLCVYGYSDQSLKDRRSITLPFRQTPEGPKAAPLHTQQVQEVQSALLGHAGASVEASAAHVGPADGRPVGGRGRSGSGGAAVSDSGNLLRRSSPPKAKINLGDLCRQSQLAKMTSELCEDGGDGQREKEAPAVSKASSVSPLSAATSLEPPGLWSSPLSPVTAPVGRLGRARRPPGLTACPLSCQEADGSQPPLRPPPGLGCSSRARLSANDGMGDWFRLLLEAEDAGGNRLLWFVGF